MKTMTTIRNAERTASGSYVATVLGGEKLGTKDPELGEKLLNIFAEDQAHCLCEIEYEQRGERLFLTGIEYVAAPEELGGPESVESSDPDSLTEQPDVTLEQLLTVNTRLTKIEEFLSATTEFEA